MIYFHCILITGIDKYSDKEKNNIPDGVCMRKLLYVDIYEQFKRLILEKKYEEKQKLPSKRKLAESLKVSPLTVEAAYQQLIAEGYVYAIEKKGYYVSKQVDIKLANPAISFQKIPKKMKDSYTYSFETNVVDTTLFPNATWAKLSREVISENHHEMLNVTAPQGLDELRIEIAKYLEIYRGMHVTPDRIIIGSGSTSMISMIVELLGRDQRYAIEKPGFHKIEQLFLANNAHIDYIPVDDQGLSVEVLKTRNIHTVHVTPSHQYPLGIVMPISRRIELLNWAAQNRAYIIEDDYDSEFRFQGKPIPALHGLDQNDRVIYMNTFTKSLAPSFRMSYMVIPQHLIHKYHEMSSYHGCTVPTFEQYVLYKFMHEGFFERHINRMRNHYREKKEVILSLIHPLTWIKLHGDEAGLHFVMEVMTEDTVLQLKTKLKQANIHATVIEDQTIFPYPCIIIGYSGIEKKLIKPWCCALIETIKPS